MDRNYDHQTSITTKIVDDTAYSSWTWTTVAYGHLHLAFSLAGDPIGISWRSIASRNQSPWPIVHRCLCDDEFSHFDRTSTCDGLTDRHAMTASIASRR